LREPHSSAGLRWDPRRPHPRLPAATTRTRGAGPPNADAPSRAASSATAKATPRARAGPRAAEGCASPGAGGRAATTFTA